MQWRNNDEINVMFGRRRPHPEADGCRVPHKQGDDEGTAVDMGSSCRQQR